MTGRLEPRWIDSHCHIYDERTPGGANAALDAARQAGVEGFVVVGCVGFIVVVVVVIGRRE